MNKRERHYIEYRPQLGIVANVQAIIEKEQEDDASYQLPTEIGEACDTTACKALHKGIRALDKLDELLDTIEENLRDDVANGLTFQDYINSRDIEGDPHIRLEWEDHHSHSPDGKLIAEVYPLLLDSRQNLVDNMDLLNSEILSGDLYHDEADDICHQEAKELDNIVRNGTDNEKTKAELKAKTELVDAIEGAIDGIQEFLDNTESLINYTVNDLFKGDIESVVEQLATASAENIERLGRFSEIGFAQYADAGDDIKERMSRVTDANILLHDEVKELRKLRREAGSLLDWLDTLETDADDSPVTEVIENSLLSVETVLDGYDDVLTDMHKTNEMQLMQFHDMIDNLYIKESHRQQCNVASQMKNHFDYKDDDRKKQVKRFVENMGYKEGLRKNKTRPRRRQWKRSASK